MNTNRRPSGATHFDSGFLKYGLHGFIYKHSTDGWKNMGKGKLLPSQSLAVLDAKIPSDKDLRSFETLTVFDQ